MMYCSAAIPRNFWENEGNVKEYVKWLEKKLVCERDILYLY